MPSARTDKTAKVALRRPATRKKAGGGAATTLRDSMVTGKAGPAKAAAGDQPVFTYIASLPQPQLQAWQCPDGKRIDPLRDAAALPGVGGKR